MIAKRQRKKGHSDMNATHTQWLKNGKLFKRQGVQADSSDCSLYSIFVVADFLICMRKFDSMNCDGHWEN